MKTSELQKAYMRGYAKSRAFNKPKQDAQQKIIDRLIAFLKAGLSI